MDKEKKEFKSFDDFTNLYKLNKTLRFSLIPVLTQKQEKEILKTKGYKDIREISRQDKEEKFFNENKQELFEVDIDRKKQYRKLKYYLTELHKLFIKDALKKIKNKNKLNFFELFENFVKLENINDEKEKQSYIKKINANKLSLSKFFGNKEGKGGVFQEIAENYYDFLESNLEDGEKILDNTDKKQRKNNVLLSQNVLLVLGKKIKDGSIKEKTKNDKNGQESIDEEYALNFKDINGKDINLIKYFEGWSTYFKNFNGIRGNLYKDDGRKEEESEDSEVGEKIKKANAGQITTRVIDENFEIFVKNFILADKNKRMLGLENYNEKDVAENLSIFDAKFYVNCLTQEDIDKYNSKIADLNKFFNEVKKGENKKDKIKYLKPLFKQLLFTSSLEKEIFVEEFLDNDDFIAGLEEFKTHSQEKINLINNFLSTDDLGNNLDEILLDENQTHFFCNQLFGSWSYFRDLYRQQNQISNTNGDNDKKEFKDKDNAIKKEFSLSEIKELLDGKNKDEFKNDAQKGNFVFNGGDNNNKSVYEENLSNFENFVLFLKYYSNSLINGRVILTKLENKDLESFKQVLDNLEKAKNEGEKIDELLLKKVSEKGFRQNINESIKDKEINFETVFEKFKEFSKNKKRLDRGNEFEFKKSVNEYCNRISEINGFFSLFSVPDGIDGNIINETVKKFKENNKIIPLYNGIRNFITKRGDELEKIKLNFDVKNLLGGWGYKTEEHPDSSDYKCRLFRKDNKIYLGIIGKSNNISLNDYQTMDYYQIKGQTIFGSVYKGIFNSEYKTDRTSLENNILLDKVEKIIDEKLLTMFPRVKSKLEKIKQDKAKNLFNFTISKNDIDTEFINKTKFKYDDYKEKNKKIILLEILKNKLGDKFDFENENDYLLNRIGELFGKSPKKDRFTGVDKMVYEITKLEPYFYKINFVDLENDNPDICALFQIYNKDFSSHKKDCSSENMHTIYFKELFSDQNLKEPIFKLSGGAEIFFRETIEDYRTEQWNRKDLKNPKTDKVPYKNRRFTENKILFYLPVVLNNINKGGNVNKKIHCYIQENNDVKILGIDRGEKELAYYCLLDKDGRICGDLKSMNETGSNIVKNQNGVETNQIINYQKKLDIKEKERMLARKFWTKIEGIKDLKKGYISNVVKDIANLMVDNNALVCLEELNYGFKRGRIRIEKNIYQQFENAMVDKLSYLVLEKTLQGVRNALQLVKSVNNQGIKIAQKYWGNQMGAIFYTDAKFTSKTCPNCGFRKRGVSDFNNVKNIREKVKNGDIRIFFEKEKDKFRIEYNWKYEFNKDGKKGEFSNQDLYGKNKMEIIYSDMERIFWDRENYEQKELNPTEELKEIFKEFYEKSEDNLAKKENHFSYTRFIQIFNNILNIRNTIKKEEDVISCPKCHFSTSSKKAEKIKNGDANGAYNIARRGLMIFEKIRSDKLIKKAKTKNGIQSKDLKIILKDWDEHTYKQWDKKDWEESENEHGL